MPNDQSWSTVAASPAERVAQDINLSAPYRPLPVPAIAGAATSATSITIGLAASSDSDASYRLQRSLDGNTWTDVRGGVLASEFDLEDDSRTPGATYLYRQRAENPHGHSEWSPVVTVTTPEEVVEPLPEGEPAISSVSGTLSQGDTITISGSGFGSKSRAVPAFVDYIDRAYEVGVENTYHSALPDGGEVLDSRTDPNGIYSENTSGAAAPLYRTSGAKRHPYHAASYEMGRTDESRIGKPKCHAWGSEGNRAERPRFYMANWFKVKWDPSDLWWVRILAEDTGEGYPFFAGGIIPAAGEVVECTIGPTTYTGHYISDNPSDTGREIAWGGGSRPSNTTLKGVTINFPSSGASFVWPAEKFTPTGGLTRILPGVKFARAWDTGNDAIALRGSFTSNDYYLSDQGRFSSNSGKLGSSLRLEREVWHLSEIMIDLEAGYATHFIDGKPRMSGSRDRITFEATEPYVDGSSFTMGLFGFDGTHGKSNRMDMESLYLDDSLQRVVISTAPTKDQMTFDAGNIYELQRPLTWADDAVSVAVNEGALDPTKDWYVYIYNLIGECNTQGYPV